MQDNVSIELSSETKALVVSDIHLRLPVTKDLGAIQRSLVNRITELTSHRLAILVLNGDIFELWEQTDQTVTDIINGFSELTEAIQKFSRGRGHKVLYVVGNHDELLSTSPTDRAVVEHHWMAEFCNQLDLNHKKKHIQIQHGHQYDPYNAPSSSGDSRGKKLVQGLIPTLQNNLPIIFNHIDDVTNRSLLGEYAIGNFLYKMFLPVIVPLTLLVSLVLSYYYKNPSVLAGAGFVLVVIVILIIVLGLVSRIVSGVALGGGKSFLNKLDKAHSIDKFNILILGHTHQGGIFKRPGYMYANSGCNDVIATYKAGWLVLPKFKRYLQMSGLTIDYSKKQAIEYHHQTIPLVE